MLGKYKQKFFLSFFSFSGSFWGSSSKMLLHFTVVVAVVVVVFFGYLKLLEHKM